MSEGVDLIDIYADEEFNQDSEFNNTDQIDLYDDVLTAASQPSDDRSSSTEPPPPVRQEPAPKPNNKTPAILYTYSGLRSRRAAVYVGSFSWVSKDNQKSQGWAGGRALGGDGIFRNHCCTVLCSDGVGFLFPGIRLD